MRRSSMGKERPGGGVGAAGQVVAVAVDADKGSQHALKWAADHILTRNQIFFLLHVRRKITSIPTPTGNQLSINDVEDEVASAFIQELDFRTKEVLLPFQCFCSRRGLQSKEVILDDMDVPKAIINFVVHQNVDKLVMGVSSRNALTRTFKQADVPTAISKIAPEFCSVYVISKGKISSIRPATRPNISPVNKPVSKLETAGYQFQSVKSEPEVRRHIGSPERSALHRGAKIGIGNKSKLSERIFDNGITERMDKVSQAQPHSAYSYQSIASCPSPSRTSIDRPPSYFRQEYADGGGRKSHLSNVQNEEPRSSWSTQSMEDVDSEIRRLKLELKQTLEMYEGACKETYITKPQEQYMKAFGELRVAEARVVGETPDETAEKERRRPKPLPESPPVMQKKIETEANKRMMNVESKSSQEATDQRNGLDVFSTGIQYRRYIMEEIQKATDNFSDALKIGEGGYGPVYKSTLDHTLVAIKILQCDVNQGMKQFQKEVEVLSCIRHPNMVLLMGACPEYGCLVYEFMANGSLEDCLFCRNNSPPLSWQLRFKIAAEIATGLLFLHQTKPEPLVHRDLKPGNILLDHNFVSKIADVGLARLVPPSSSGSMSTQYRMTAAAGTFCYIDPEYQKTGMLGIKSDIYALGIILIQLVTGMPPMGLAHNAERAMENGKFEEMLDPKVKDWPMEETLKFARLALKCAELQRKDRPDLALVVLPELNRLRALADSMMDTPWMYRCEGSRSYQEISRRSQARASEIYDDGPAPGSSFA